MDKLQERKLEFANLLKLDQSRLYGYIHSLVRDLNDTDDIFQQAALILWKKFDTFERDRCFFSWACGIARFECANFLRSRGRKRLYFSDELNLLLIEAQEKLSSDESEARRQALNDCIEKLRERDRVLLRECYADDAVVSDAADRHGRSPQSVYNSLRRIRRALFECIGRVLSLGNP
jgi:RNA polymerase sigma-70 factor (ECF subfamily)